MANAKAQDQYVKLKYYGIPKLVPYVKPHTRTIIWMIFYSLIGAGIAAVTPMFQRYAINHFVGGNTLDTIWLFVAIYMAVLLIQTCANVYSSFLGGRIEMHVTRDLRKASFNHLQTLSFSYYNQNSVGYIHSRIMSDTNRIGGLVSWSLMDSVSNIAYLLIMIVSMFVIHWQMALLITVLIPITAVLSVLFQKKLIFHNRRVREFNSRISGNFNEGITGAKTTKTLVAEDRMNHDFNKTSREMTKASITASHFRQLFVGTISFTSYLALALVLWRGGKITMEQVMELGTLSVFTTYAINIMEPIQWIVRALSDLVTVQVNVERFTKLMETESDVADTPEVVEKYGDTFHPKKENWEPLNGDVEFKDVSFKYPDGDEFVLEHFDLKVPQGTNVAIVGETGAGKSTLVNLVCRFFEPTMGQVLIDGRDARERSQLWLHSNIGYVLQTPHLFSGTVRENLLYGRPDATQEEIEAAVKAVSAEGVIARMDKGYDSDVGEGGDLLSTGEKQLLSFARAILADPRIFVLDEATSSIDTVTEKLIQDAIDKLMKGRTSFVIAHRLSTIRQADVILVVKDGKIIERGTHTELMKKQGYYYGLYTRQFQEENMKKMGF